MTKFNYFERKHFYSKSLKRYNNLVYICKYGDIDNLDWYIKNKQNTFLMEFIIKFSDLDKIIHYIYNYNSNIEEMLVYACKIHRLDLVKYLLNNLSVDVNYKTGLSLYNAVLTKDKKIINLLLINGAIIYQIIDHLLFDNEIYDDIRIFINKLKN